MPTVNFEDGEQKYDDRWFIWTIVFLVVSGISLVSYITLSDSGAEDVVFVPSSRAAGK